MPSKNVECWWVFGSQNFKGWCSGNLVSMGQSYSNLRSPCKFCGKRATSLWERWSNLENNKKRVKISQRGKTEEPTYAKALWALKPTRSSAIARRPCDAKACQGLLKWTWKWQPRLKWPSKYFNVIKSGTNRKLVYDFLLVVYCNFCRITHRFWEIWCETVQWRMPKVIDSSITWKLSCGHVCKMFGRQWTKEAKIDSFNYPTLIWRPLSSEPPRISA